MSSYVWAKEEAWGEIYTLIMHFVNISGEARTG